MILQACASSNHAPPVASDIISAPWYKIVGLGEHLLDMFNAEDGFSDRQALFETILVDQMVLCF